MKKYRCTVCGYIHEGEPLPDYCPNCGANKDKFDPVIDPEEMVDSKI